ncbi:MAG: STAS domain-containing protein [Clostridiales bacterium]|jgi:anti-sigma B factor antagonist|nr:STAS domain-containing protein [Clostridiales bacterium]
MNFILESSYDEEHKRWNAVISGEVDIFESDAMKNTLLQLVLDKQGDLFIDCRGLEYIDSTALGALVAVNRNVAAAGYSVHLLNIRPNLAKLFKITNLDHVFILEGDINEK